MRQFKVLTPLIMFLCFCVFSAVGAYADSQSWVLTGTNNGPACSSISPCAEVTLSVNAAGTQATFTVTSLNPGYIFDTFGFNGPSGLVLASASGEVGSYSLGGAGNEDGWGSFAYNFNTGKNGGSSGGDCTSGPSAGCTFTFTVNGTGLSLASFEISSSGGTGSGFFAGHVANANGPTGYVGSPSAVPEPSSMALLGSGLIGLGTVARRKLRR